MHTDVLALTSGSLPALISRERSAEFLETAHVSARSSYDSRSRQRLPASVARKPSHSYPWTMRAIARFADVFSDYEYTVRNGLLHGMRRHGGLAWIPWRGKASAEDRWLAAQSFTGKIIYDVGAFHGLLTLYFAKTARMVYSFEPLAEHRRIIERNIRLNGLQAKVTLIPYGAGSHFEIRNLVVDPLLPGTASADPALQRTLRGNVVPIAIRPIDALELPPPDVVKLDIEGLELAALKGMIRTLVAHRPTLCVEIHGATPDSKRANAHAIIAFLCSVGYSHQYWLEDHSSALTAWTWPRAHLIAHAAS